MSRGAAVMILIVAAGLEAGGDAILRAGLHAPSPARRADLFLVAGGVLFAYGWTVNAPPWEFSKLLGLYVVFFFAIVQLLSWLVFKQPPSTAVLIGGVFILAGGLIVASAQS